MREATPSRRSNSASTSPSVGSGAKRSTGGKKLRSSTRLTWRLTTILASPTSTRVSSTKRGKLTRRPSNWIRTTRRSGRTTSCSRKSMTGPPRAKKSSVALAGVAAVLAAFVLACGADYYEIPIETPIQPKLDVSPFQRVLVAGFVAGGSEDVHANQATVLLLRSQLPTKPSLRVITAGILPLMGLAHV